MHKAMGGPGAPGQWVGPGPGDGLDQSSGPWVGLRPKAPFLRLNLHAYTAKILLLDMCTMIIYGSLINYIIG
jgi:hypothetical protein